tara:strand:+ start:4552 stop:4728 length:177 start_codon:yes stop_codon:yes gene_type:complete
LEFKMQEYYESEFWEMVYQEYGVADEIDILSEQVVQIVYPRPGVIILFTNEADSYDQE